MRISDWSSDVCSSDLREAEEARMRALEEARRREDLERNRNQDEERRRAEENRRAEEQARTAGETEAEPQEAAAAPEANVVETPRSEEHTSELQSLMRISYAVFCLKKKKNHNITNNNYEAQIT